VVTQVRKKEMENQMMLAKKTMTLLCLVGVVLASVAGSQPAYGGEYHWIALGDGVLHAPTSWVPYGVPGSADIAIFDQPATYYAYASAPQTTHKQLKVTAGEVKLFGGVQTGDCWEPSTYDLLGAGTLIRTAAIVGTQPHVPATLRAYGTPWYCGPDFTINADGMLVIAQTADSIGTVEVGNDTNHKTIWTSTSPTLVGVNGTGVLEVQWYDELTNSSAVVGQAATANGTASVWGTWTNNGALTIGADGTGTLGVHDEVINTGDAYVAREPGSVGTVIVDPQVGGWHIAEGWLVGGSLYVGGDAQGAGGAGTVTVSDQGDLIVDQDITVWGTGEITADTGFIEADNVDIRGGGEIALNGEQYYPGGWLECGHLNMWADGMLDINYEGWVNCTSAHCLGTVEIDDGTLTVANHFSSTGGCEVNMSVGTLNAGTLAAYDGTWNWTGGAVNVTGDSLSIDVDEPFGKHLPVYGSKLLSVSDSLNVGPSSDGVLSVTAGGSIESGSAVIGSLSPTALQAVAIVAGTGTSWTIAGDLAVGGAAVPLLSVSDGATVSNNNAHLASEDGTTALVTMAGTDARWECAGDLYAGGDAATSRGASTIEVDDGAELSVGGTVKVWSDSVIEVDGGTVVTADLDIVGEVVLLGSGVLDARGGIVDIDAGATLNGTIFGDSWTDVGLHGNYASWLASGSVIVGAGDEGIGHIGAVALEPGATVTVDETMTVQDPNRLILAGGTVNAAVIDLLDADFSDFGTLNGEFLTTGSLAATGTLTVGDLSSYNAVQIDNTLDVGPHDVTINSNGAFAVGQSASIAGGTLMAPNGISLPTGSNLVGHGTVATRVAAQIGSTIEADGGLSLGDATSPVGFVTDGDLVVNAATVTIEDADQAVLGPLTSLGGEGNPGTVAAANGLVLATGDNVLGFGAIDTPDDPTKPLINDGSIYGNSAGEPIELTGYVKGIGTLDNVIVSGTDAPGVVGPAAVNRGSVDYAGQLVIEIGGLAAGSGYDQVNHSGAANLGGELTVELFNGFEPGPGNSFTILTYGSHSGQFDTLTLPALAAGLAWHVDYGASDFTLLVEEQMAGDCDMDGDTDLTDYGQFKDCLTGPGSSVPAGCGCFDVNNSGTVDLADFALLQAAFTGSN
jgi:T5SS/PEP-CTERM-associated repeat protein